MLGFPLAHLLGERCLDAELGPPAPSIKSLWGRVTESEPGPGPEGTGEKTRSTDVL